MTNLTRLEEMLSAARDQLRRGQAEAAAVAATRGYVIDPRISLQPTDPAPDNRGILGNMNNTPLNAQQDAKDEGGR